MNNQNYWINRSNQRMYEYLSDSHKVISEIEKAYRESERYIKSETDNIFRNFVNHTGISETEARLLLKTSIGKTTVDKLKSALSSVKDEDIRKQMLAEINMPAYQARIKRFEELNSNIVKECNRLYGTELKMSTNLYTDIADKAFSRTIYDIQKGTGIGYSFAQLPKSRIEEILRNNWSGKHYSQRIWGNTRKLADDLKQDLLSGLLSGKSGRKIAEDISRRYGVGIHNAERLVRTESNYIANQAEIESYKESGIEKYRYIATLDSRTSEVCRELDGKEFLVSEAQAGVNLPPMHAHCRSTTISVINEKCLENLERRARKPDGTTEKVPADMTYKEWEAEQKKNNQDVLAYEDNKGNNILNSSIQNLNSIDGLTSANNKFIINGRGSGTGDNNYEHYYKLEGSIDYNNKKAVAQALKDFEKENKNSKIEKCIVITEKGEKYIVYGDRWTVNTELLGDKMKGSINEHNHVTGESQYSFSYEDLKSSIADGSKIAIAFDEKYRYFIQLPDKTITEEELYEAFENAKNDVGNIRISDYFNDRVTINDEDEWHEIIKRTCEQVGIAYERTTKQ